MSPGRAALHLGGVALSLLLAGCPKPPPPPPPSCAAALGDPTQPMRLEPVYIGVDARVRDLVGCGPIDIVPPPQGGQVFYVGVRATNLDGCGALIEAALRDPESGGILGADRRTVNLVSLSSRPGWGTTGTDGDLVTAGFSDFANITICPNVNGRDIQRLAGRLEITLKDVHGQRATIALDVMPRCAQRDPVGNALCECTCAANATMDRCKNITDWDAGTALGSCPPPDGMSPTDGPPPRDGG